MWRSLRNFALENRWLLGILALTLSLLFYRISYRTFWMDETAVLNYLKLGPIDFLKSYWLVPDNHPPLYYLLAVLVTTVLPWSELTVRLISILSGFGIVILVYFFTLRVTNERRLALLASFFTGFSSYFILISQMARYHSLAAFFCLLAFYFFYLFLRENNAKAWYYYLAILVITAYSDYPQFFYIAVLTNLCFIYCLIRRQTLMSFWKWTLGQFVAAVACLPLVWIIYNRIVIQGDGGWSSTNLLGNSWLHIIAGIFLHIYVYFFGENIFPWNYLFFILGCIVLVGVVVGLVSSLKNKFWHSPQAFIILLSASLIVLNTLFMNIADPRYNFIVYPKFGFVAFPFWIMTFVICISYLKSKKIQVVLFTLWFVVSLYGLCNFYTPSNYLNASYFNNFKSFEFVRDNSVLGDYLITSGDANPGIYDFYKDKYFKNLSPVWVSEVGAVKGPARLWFFATGSDAENTNNSTDSKIPVGLKILRRFDSVPLNVTLKSLKERITGYESYTYKYSLYLLTN